MKSEQERVEKEAPVFHIHNNRVDLEAIQRRIKETKGFSEKKRAIEVDYTYEPREEK